MCVQSASISAISFSSTVSPDDVPLPFHWLFNSSASFAMSFSSSRILAAFSKSWAVIASSFSLFNTSSRASLFLSSSGSVCEPRRFFDAASSIRSIALSGRKRSVIYLEESFAAASRASSVIVTPWCASYLSRMPFNI